MPASTKKELSSKERDAFLETLRDRFKKNKQRHEGLDWAKVESRLKSCIPSKLWSLHQMEVTGGEPDVVNFDKKSGEYTFYDCAAESPKGRRSICYDREGLESRKEHRPKTSALDMASAMGIEVLTEDQYRALQKLGSFDAKTSSWLQTPVEIRKQGGAIFGDYRFDQVFIYHNGAQSYYGSRAFRGSLKI